MRHGRSSDDVNGKPSVFFAEKSLEDQGSFVSNNRVEERMSHELVKRRFDKFSLLG